MTGDSMDNRSLARENQQRTVELETANQQLQQAITERTQAEQAVRDSEERLRLFITHAPAAMAMFDREMRYVAASRRWLSDYGLGNRDLRGQSHYEVFPDLPDRWRPVHRRGLSGEVVTAEADRFDRADGTVQWLHWEVHPWYDRTGQGSIIIFTEDITERQRATEHILRLNAELEQRVRERTAQLEETVATLQQALEEIKTLRGIVPICSYCKKMRNDSGYWQQVESYLHDHTEAEFSHGLCPSCLAEHYGEFLRSASPSE